MSLLSKLIHKVTKPFKGGKRKPFAGWGDLVTRGYDFLKGIILKVEAESDSAERKLNGPEKKTLAIELIMSLVDIPFVPGNIERDIWSLIIDLAFKAWRDNDPTQEKPEDLLNDFLPQPEAPERLDLKPDSEEVKSVVDEITKDADEIIEEAEEEPEDKKRKTQSDIIRDSIDPENGSTIEMLRASSKANGIQSKAFNRALQSAMKKGLIELRDERYYAV